MIKSFLIIIIFQISLYCDEQVILVVSKDFNSPKAQLECYEGSKKVFDTIEVNIGTNGLGWGLGLVELKKSNLEPLKKEGDKKAPAGVFGLPGSFGYESHKNLKVDYVQASQTLICVDDIESKEYNKIIQMPKLRPKSFESMRREDNQYELGVVVAHNVEAKKSKGSCIFLHVEKSEGASTAGCTSMKSEQLQKIVSWLDKSKNPILIQIPHSSSKEVLELYPSLKSSKLLY
jgi:hypothetical protein